MKISRLEWITILLCAVFLAFAAGWFLRGRSAAQPVRVETQRVLAQETPLVPALPASSPGAPEVGEKININTAQLEELTALPGIGEKRARDIIAYRTQNGPFRIPEDLTRVSGIGEGILEGLIDYITVS